MSKEKSQSAPVTVDQKRHSLSHLMAQAVLEMFPEAKLAIGPTIDNGFYYDFELPRTLIPEDLPLIEKKMKQYIRQNQKFEHHTEPVDQAIKFYHAAKQPFKAELIADLKTKGETEVGFYKNGNFVDLCKGPHVDSTNQIEENSFKLDKIAGAYWRGDEKRPMLQRIYGLAFDAREELDKFLELRKEAERRDHRKLGKELKLFTISELVGAGLPLIQPRGMIIRKAIEDFLWELHHGKGYLRVWTPHLAREALYVTSGHAAKFGHELFRVTGGEDKFFMKPMNCPHHMQIYADNQFSYRDMPIRYFEPATVYRDEKSGQLSGLTRVRAITQDDGHLFCRVTQIGEEVSTIVAIIRKFYETMGMMSDYWVSLSVRGDDRSKYLGTDQAWDTAEKSLEEAAKANDLNYKRIEGEAAFYGPKLDFIFKDSLGRPWQLATIQCDFNLPERFNLDFINEAGEKERPVVIHRAISGSLERFMGILIEHFAGAFPPWLAPVQVVLIPVAETHERYAEEVRQKLLAQDIRVETYASNETLGKRVRNADMQKVPYMLVLGDKEVESDSVCIRRHGSRDQTTVKFDAFLNDLVAQVKERKLS